MNARAPFAETTLPARRAAALAYGEGDRRTYREMSYLRREDVVFAGKKSNQTDKNESENQRP